MAESSENRLCNSRSALLFPGQGSQAVAMLRSLRVAFPELQGHVDALNPLFTTAAGEDVLTIIDCEKTPENEARLTLTQNAQPALGLMESAILRWIKSWGLEFDFTAGHSYGELPALLASGYIDEQTLATLSRERGRLLHDAGSQCPGALVALIASQADAEVLLRECNSPLEKANLNAPAQIVLGGKKADVEAFAAFCREKGKKAVLLKAACAFHTSLMAGVVPEWRDFLDRKITLLSSHGPAHVANVSADISNRDGSTIKASLAAQISNPVRWVETIEKLYDMGVRLFVEAGPGRVLCGLVEKILSGRECLCISLDPESRDPHTHILDIKNRLGRKSSVKNSQPVASSEALPIVVPGKPKTVRVSSLAELANANVEVFRMYIEKAESVTLGLGKDLPEESRTDAALHFMEHSHRALESFLNAQTLLTGLGNPSEETRLEQTLLAKDREGPTMPRAQVANAVPAKTETPAKSDSSANSEAPISPAAPASPEAWLRDRIAAHTGFSPEKIESSKPFDAMGLDSISMIEILGGLIEAFPAFGEYKAKLYTVRTIHDVVSLVAKQGSSEKVEKKQRARSRYMRELEQAFLKASGKQSIDWNVDLEKAAGLEPFTREEIVRDILVNWPRFRFAGQELTNLCTLKQIEEFLARMSVTEALPQLETLLQTRSRRDEVLSFVLKPEQDTYTQVHLPDIPPRIILVVPENETAAQLAQGFLGQTSRVEVIVAKENEWSLCGDRHIAVEDVSGLASALKEIFPSLARTLLVFAPVFPDDAFSAGDEPLWKTQLKVSGERYFLFAKALQLSGIDKEGLHICALGKQRSGPAWGATRGLVKALGKEWPEIFASAVCLGESITEVTPQKIMEAILVRKGSFGTKIDSSRVTVSRFVTAQARSSRTSPSLPSNPLFVLAGGGTGITAEFAFALAETYPGCRIVALGRTSFPGGDSSRQKEITATAERLRRVGAEFFYQQVDMLDCESTAQCFAEIRKAHGDITGYVHGVGITEDALLGTKSLESFRKVLFAKTLTLPIIQRALATHPVQFITLVSSLSSVVGTAGQTDYGAANDLLNECARQWVLPSGAPVVSMLWGVWNDVGLAGDHIWKRMKAMGVDGIAPNEGRRLFIENIFPSDPGENCLLFSPLSMLSFALREETESLP